MMAGNGLGANPMSMGAMGGMAGMNGMGGMGGMMGGGMMAAAANSEFVYVRSENLLLAAVKARDPSAVERLLSSRAPYMADPDGDFPLHWAVLNNDFSIVELLVKYQVNIHARNNKGETALHWAAVGGHLKMNVFLVGAGADPNGVDNKGFTVIHRSAQQGHTLLIDYYLHSRHMDINTPDKDGRNALHWASYSDHPITVEFLIKNGANNNTRDCEQCLPIHWAAIRGNTKSIHVLLKHGSRAQLDLVDCTGCTPFSLANNKYLSKKTAIDNLKRTLGENSRVIKGLREAAAAESGHGHSHGGGGGGHGHSHGGGGGGGHGHSHGGEGSCCLIRYCAAAMGCCMLCAGGACCIAVANVVMSRETRDRRLNQCKHALGCAKAGEQAPQSNASDDKSDAYDAGEATAMGLVPLSPTNGSPISSTEDAALQLDLKTEAPAVAVNPANTLFGGASMSQVMAGGMVAPATNPLDASLTPATGGGAAGGHGHSHGGQPCHGHGGAGPAAPPEPLTADELKYIELNDEIKKFSAAVGVLAWAAKTARWKSIFMIPVDFEMTVPRGIVSWLTFIMAAGIYVYTQILYDVVKLHTLKNYTFLFAWCNMVVWWYFSTTSDPGYVTQKAGSDNTRYNGLRTEYLGFLDNPGVTRRTDGFCVTCRLKKPLRSKHCATCDVCVDRFDHHCPWINNCVGKKNHRFFVLFLMSTVLTTFMINWLGYVYFSELHTYTATVVTRTAMVPVARAAAAATTAAAGTYASQVLAGTGEAAGFFTNVSQHKLLFGWILHYLFYMLFCTCLSIQHLQMMSTNITINEAMNFSKYEHFRVGLQFRNPFDMGFRENMQQFWFMKEAPPLAGFFQRAGPMPDNAVHIDINRLAASQAAFDKLPDHATIQSADQTAATSNGNGNANAANGNGNSNAILTPYGNGASTASHSDASAPAVSSVASAASVVNGDAYSHAHSHSGVAVGDEIKP